MIRYRAIDSPIGLLTLAGHGSALTNLRMVDQTYEPSSNGWSPNPKAFNDAVDQLNAYFAGELTIKVLYSAGTGHNHLSYSQHCRGRSTSGQERCRHSLYHSRPWVSQCAVANQPSPPQHDLSACIGELVRSTSD